MTTAKLLSVNIYIKKEWKDAIKRELRTTAESGDYSLWGSVDSCHTHKVKTVL